MGFVYDFDSLARVLEFAEPTVYNGPCEIIIDGLIEAGEIKEEAGVIQKVVTVNKAATATETAGETLSALCAMDVSESTVAGVTTTTLTPKAAITFTPKTVALCGIAGALGLDFGFRLGQNLVNLYFGEEWDWHAPGIFDVAKDAIRTYVTADGTTYYDEETINAFSNRLNEIGVFADDNFDPASLIFQEYSDNLTYSNFNLTSTIKLPNRNSADIKEQKLYVLLAKLLSDYNVVISPNTLTIIYGYSTRSTELILEQYIIPENSKVALVSGELLNKDIKDFNGYYQTDLNFGTTNGSLFFDKNQIKRTLRIDMNSTINDDLIIENVVPVVDDNVVDIAKQNGVPIYLYSYRYYGKYFAFNMGDITEGGISGVNKQQDATVPSTFPLEIPQTYPAWQPRPINKPDGAIQTYPVEMPDTDPLAEKATKPQNEAQKGVNQNPENDPVIGSAIVSVPEIVPNIPTPQDPTIDGGDTPTPIIPSIGAQATGFVALYNPTQSQLSAFSQYLWSNDFIENFKKLFSNPMDAIIGLHLIYATPSRGSDAEIVCGYSHSGVMSKTVNSQYIEIDCGSIKVNRYFGNVLDYAPYTKLQVYLPFVGIVDLDTNEIMNGTLNIKYRIDVLTGSCLARLKITRGDYKAELYNFAGNCAVQLPISGGSYSGIIANAIGVAGSIGATIASGGSLAPVLVGSAVSSAVNSHTNVSHSGSLGSNAGALGIMKPYLIITRPKPAEANNFNEFYGKPSNKTVRLSSCSGYTRIKEVHVDNIVATDNELSEIEQLLKEGVII